jgi:hypothetical protein
MKAMKPKGKKVAGSNYVEADETFDKKMKEKAFRDMKTAGLAKNLQKSEKDIGYSKMPQVKGQKKTAKITHGQKKIK